MLKKQELPERKYHLVTSNKKAYFDFEIIQTLEAGLVLSGTEVKSLRAGKCNLQDSYAGFKSKNVDDLFLFNLSISEYAFGNRENHDTKRPRKLLLHKKELIKWRSLAVEKSMTIVPLKIYFSGHLVKVEISLCKPKKRFDKREVIKERDGKREVQRSMKN